LHLLLLIAIVIMVEDTKMTDASASTDEKKKKEEDTTKSEEEEPPKPPPLQAAGLRLERLLSDPSYTNPAKVVRRWLTTSSGASAAATLDSIGQAAKALLDPCPETLANLASESMMETDDDDKKSSPAPPPTPVYLKEAALPFEAWLVSLAVRCYYKQDTSAAAAEQALALAQQGIDKLSTQLQTDLVRSTATALYPLLARLVRWRALVIEQRLPAKAAPLRQVMAQAYNMATLRRDADTQATLLNCMLRDLLHSSQSKFVDTRSTKRDVFCMCAHEKVSKE
jgi:26S proteasome regulatory subunit N3